MANVHVKLRRRAADARDDPATCVVVVNDTVKDILIVRVDARVLAVKISWLSVGEVIVRVRSREAQ